MNERNIKYECVCIFVIKYNRKILIILFFFEIFLLSLFSETISIQTRKSFVFNETADHIFLLLRDNVTLGHASDRLWIIVNIFILLCSISYYIILLSISYVLPYYIKVISVILSILVLLKPLRIIEGLHCNLPVVSCVWYVTSGQWRWSPLIKKILSYMLKYCTFVSYNLYQDCKILFQVI